MINFPNFPNITSATYNDEDGTVTMTLSDWLKIADYVIDIKGIEKTLATWREIDKEKE